MESALCDVLSQLKVSGSLLLHHKYSSPIAIEVPNANTIRRLLGVKTPCAIVPFHLALQGQFEFSSQSSEKVMVNQGGLVMSVNGSGHQLCVGDAGPSTPFQDILTRKVAIADDGNVTEIMCGVFMLNDTRRNPLIQSLPSTLFTPGGCGEESTPISLLIDLLLAEMKTDAQGSGYMISRTLEMLFAQTVRRNIEHAFTPTGLWLQALREPRLSNAINYIHKHFSEDVSVSKLANEVHLSEARFAALFKQHLQTSPKAYLAKWRMSIAVNHLENSAMSTSQLAEITGYSSVAAFNHAFKRIVGCSPSHYRKTYKNSQTTIKL